MHGIIMVGCWILWKRRNNIRFSGISVYIADKGNTFIQTQSFTPSKQLRGAGLMGMFLVVQSKRIATLQKHVCDLLLFLFLQKLCNHHIPFIVNLILIVVCLLGFVA
ncbi:hypothetical protein HanOQP8_Chr09g0344021 [Helianthus annuus]|nr:hypothetical protein HanOQP8_Chr09g0344021 [Helianthus annuus]